MHARAPLLTAAAVALAGALAACGSDTDQGTAERATRTASSAAPQSPECGPDSTLSQFDWMEQCDTTIAEPTEQTDLPDTELAVGDTFAYNDGLKIRVDSIREITQFGETDTRPEAGQFPFRVTFTVTNGTDKPYDLDDLGPNAEGATTGGMTTSLYVEPGSKETTGRLAPGRSAMFTEEYSIAKSDATSIVFSISRNDEVWLEQSSAWLGDDPHWTGPIR